jgi:hypothetical protein
MTWNKLGVKWEPVASLGGVGWVYIDPIPKLAVITCTGVALPRCNTAAKIRGTATALKNSTGHLIENAITFYFELRFQ